MDRSGRDFSCASGEDHYNDQPPDGEEGVAHRVGDRVPEPGDGASGLLVDHAEGGRGGPGSSHAAEQDGGVELEHVLRREHAQDERQGGCGTPPQRKREMPSSFRPATKFGPAVRPTTAMKMFRPTEFMNQTVGSGM